MAGEEEVVGRLGVGGVPPQRETFGEEEDKLQSETGRGLRARAQVGKQNGERGRQRAGDRDVEHMTDSGSSGERE